MSTNVVLSDEMHSEEYIHSYLNYSKKIVKFLENSVNRENNQSIIHNILLDHHLHVWSTLKDKEDIRKTFEEKIVKLLQNPEVHYDKDQTLTTCLMLNFKPGILYLCEKSKLYQPILHYHLSQKDMDSAINFCRKFGNHEPRLWVEMFWNLSSSEHLPEVLDFIANQKLLPSSVIIDHLTNSTIFTLKDIKKYLNNLLKDDLNIREDNNLRNESKVITSPPLEYKISQFATCSQSLKSPTRHFQCSHSCKELSENECSTCTSNNKKLSETSHNPNTNDQPTVSFSAQLEKLQNGISVLEYYGWKVFNKLKFVNSDDSPHENKSNSNVKRLDNDDSVSEDHTFTPETPDSSKKAHQDTSNNQEIRRRGFKSFTFSRNNAQTSKAPLHPFEDITINPFYKNPTKTPSKNPFENDDSHQTCSTSSNNQHSWGSYLTNYHMRMKKLFQEILAVLLFFFIFVLIVGFF